MTIAAALTSSMVLALASFIGVEIVRRWALRRDVLDIPNERSSHRVPVPRGGGIAIVVVSIAGIVAWQAIEQFALLRQVATIVAAAASVAVISWIDDLHGLPASLRFSIHVLAAATVVAGFGYVDAIVITPQIVLPLAVFGMPLTVLWIVGLTNAYNFMDGIDGIAAMQALVAAAGWMWISSRGGDDLTLALAAVVLGAVLGFVPHNWHPARIFMGDVGSAFLGFTFAVLPLTSRSGDVSFMPGVMLVWPFVFDTSFTLLRRMFRRERLTSAHRSHLYQRLTQSGLSHSSVVVIYGILAASGIVAALLERGGHPLLAILVVGILASLLWAGTVMKERQSRFVSSESTPSRLPHSADLQ